MHLLKNNIGASDQINLLKGVQAFFMIAVTITLVF
jgi:hypothetical protein